jgi:hypothetical protein
MNWKGWIGPAAVVLVSVIIAVVLAITPMPNRWSGAIALKICRDGTPILRLLDGSMWARRNGFTAYRVEDMQTVCG